ncbi:hypothetical protein F9L33_12510 [Amylibacter sp. SFDW26]|uniref:hypothetical protein n=1 Tax=Amylibacter sp. SFDW26 TaxID=2652722 RepID=UPI001261B188|nr:hypothetical protein [Amylibacter sp. SFDW26]KAB7613414.1 hypothetical protein F9L33_12510 [Amylibacter sp. SFDW26]
MRTLIIAATAALTLTPTASFAGDFDIPVYVPDFYAEFTQDTDKASVTKEDTASPKIIAVKAKTEQDADN